MTETEAKELNLILLSEIDKRIPFKGNPVDKSFLALALYDSINELGFENISPKINHLFLLNVMRYTTVIQEEEDEVY